MIVLDVGNTHLRAARLASEPAARPDALRLEPLLRAPTPRGPAALDAVLRELAHVGADADLLTLVSVVPDVTAELRRRLPVLAVVDHRSPLPYGVGVAEPAAVGADRYANLAAAAAMGWTDALVVDAGTAVTYDVLEAGVFTGGMIAPGPAFAARALGEAAARLAPQPFAPTPLEPGRDTGAAMRAGAWQQGMRGVIATIAALQAAAPERPLVLTGGLAPLLDDPSLGAPPSFPDAVRDPDWTLKGALLLTAGTPPLPGFGRP
ncbi:MAG TPA: type III pantothenate kinase [Candidatus Krumholzibacteria bacterium]|nr:type III pantothenate kinase [Candidatus Krumholzibacteria bacterium]HRX51682.1 type III pantothenate kinase [Candidatus Krumholzibacteria bacterium]